ncbi:M36 family metallopeptidase [Nocardioides sp.]|uniref:M36 family metallopeptidase n=1 Tax=Nocardioides sp. TaxID=35761 RepID=UPI003519858E
MTSDPRNRATHLARRTRLTLTAAVLAATAVPGLLSLPALAESPDAVAPTAASAVSTLAEDVRTLGDPVAGLSDVDARVAVAPTALQRRALRSLQAREDLGDVRWGRFGTPTSLLPRDGVLARTGGRSPVAAARAYLARERTLFGLSAAQVRGLDAIAQPLVGTDATAVFLRQRFGGLLPALGSAVTVGVSDGAIRYVSSSLTRGGAAPAAVLTPREGWLAAARDVGLDLGLARISGITTTVADGWTRLDVPGLLQEQQVRLRALALGDGRVRPVLESNVVDVVAGQALAYTVMVDAVDGTVLHRENQVENSSDAFPFSGATTATACGPRHSFEVTDGATRSIQVVASYLNVANDLTLSLLGPGGATLASQDLATSPEVLSYSAASIPAGTYAAQVCPFESPTTPLLPPFNYAMTVVTSDAEAPSPDLVTDYNPRWRYFAANPRLDSPTQTPRNSVVGCWRRTTGCSEPSGELRNVAAPGPWDYLTAVGLPSNTTVGNNANTHEAWVSPLTPGGLAQAPISATGSYTTRFTDAWNNSRCNPTELVPGGNDIDFSVQNLFASHNRMHDYAYYLGFTEENYNLQLDNLGRGGTEGDQEIGNAQAGALTGGQPSFLGRDNANQIALQDGVPGITNQYLFQPIAGAFYAPCTDGGLDMGIVGHEYTHAISNRMVGGPDEGLTSEHGGAMGESWSDLVAAEYQFSHGYRNGGNIWAVGVYATGNRDVAIRDYSIDHNPLNFSDYGFDTTGAEVHSDGEIWNGTQWEVRQALVEKYRRSHPYGDRKAQLACANADATTGVVPAQQCPGNRRWVQLMFDSFLLQQGATSMLDARDAMLAADRMRFGGADVPTLWAAFARRGMGEGAKVSDAEDTDPRPSFRAPGRGNRLITFRTAAPGEIFVGDYEARVTPVADTLRSTRLTSRTAFTPGTYDLLYVGRTHGFMRFTLTVPAGGGKQTVTVATSPNLAAKASGARVIAATPGSRNPGFLIDGTEEFSWRWSGERNVDVVHPRIAVDLAGKVHTVRTVAVSAMLRPAFSKDDKAGSRFTALRRFAIESCLTHCGSPSARWKRVYTSSPAAFPALRPRPVAPNLVMRAFAIRPTRAAAVRLVVLENQCTGYRGYAGELDADPLNDTDCRTASESGLTSHVAELQAFTTRFGSWRSSYGILAPERSIRR